MGFLLLVPILHELYEGLGLGGIQGHAGGAQGVGQMRVIAGGVMGVIELTEADSALHLLPLLLISLLVGVAGVRH